MAWNQTELHTLLQKQPEIQLVNDPDNFIIRMNEYGDLPVSIFVTAQQIIIETLICPVSAIANTENFNVLLLRSQKILPLSSVGLTTINNEEYYVAFGALSLNSSAEDILLEITTLAHNALELAEFADEFLQHGL